MSILLYSASLACPSERIFIENRVIHSETNGFVKHDRRAKSESAPSRWPGHPFMGRPEAGETNCEE